MKLFVAEKPSDAKVYASLLGATKVNDGYFSNDSSNIVVTYCFGHLFQAVSPEELGFVSWSLSHLPIIPKDGLKYKPINGKQKQIKTIINLSRKANEVYCVTDSGREGELIFRELLPVLQLPPNSKVFRVWENSRLDEDLKKSIANAKPISYYDPIYDSARARAYADWLVGINFTTKATLSRGGSGEVISIGRVQTPTLAIVCKRFLENKNFKVKDFYFLEFTVNINDVPFVFKSDKLNTKDEAQILLDHILSKGSNVELNIIETSFSQKQIKPPLLYSLATLQIDANKKFGYSAQSTLDNLQVLYESKLVTYPRTSSEYILESMFPTIPPLLDEIYKNEKFQEYKKFQITPLNNRVVNDSKVDDHYAILPTGLKMNIGKGINDVQANLYSLIVLRTLAAFNEDGINLSVKISAEINNVKFIANNTLNIKQGFRSILNYNQDEKEIILVNNINSLIDTIKKLEGNTLNPPMDLNIASGKTTPPALLTEATLLELMVTCGRSVSDPEVAEGLKEFGIGRESTRAQIIELLKTRNFIQNKGKSIIPTELGLIIYESLKSHPITSVELTGKFESMLNKIAKSEDKYLSFINGINQFVIKELDNIQITKAPQISINCPKCSKLLTITHKVVKCNSCEFILYKEIAGKVIDDKNLIDLINNKQTSLIKGFKSKTGKKFDAKLILNDFKVELKFDPIATKKKVNNKYKP